ncbi:MAG: DUF2135 domain-containing protein [Acidobacteria bacterium]|nr:MAG: DUF2135 domain-containing protein [Acidobacteriota bacterium]
MSSNSCSRRLSCYLHLPTGEQASYSNRLTEIGRAVSKDFTEGYGSEEYVLRKAVPGTYRIEVDYYGSDVQKLQGPVTVQADIYANYGRPNEKRQRVTVRLTGEKDRHHIADIEF